MVAFSPASFAAVHSPIFWPARKLSVANVMSTDSGSDGRGVERDHEEAGVAGLHERVFDGGAVRA